MMTGSNGGSHIMAACEECSAVYAAIEYSDGNILPIGSRDGCGSCGSTEFRPISGLVDDLELSDDESGD